VRYTYYKTGDASNITLLDAGDPWFRDLALYYTRGGRLSLAVTDRWPGALGWYPAEDHPQYVRESAREFRYDSPRGRYLARYVVPYTFERIGVERWMDYEGDEPYGDIDVTATGGTPLVANTMRYLDGISAQQTVSTGATQYMHAELIGSTKQTTDAGSAPVSQVSYTAFGELINTSGGARPAGFPRYQYAGAWGYESGLLSHSGAPGTAPITLQHVGARWYQPAIGQFLQRDSAGVFEALNCYNYCGQNPLAYVDPLGSARWVVNRLGHGAVTFVRGDECIEIGIKMEVVWDRCWWHWLKDVFQHVCNGILCASIGGFGKVYKLSVPRPTGPPDIPTAPEEDAALDAAFSDGDYVYYDLWWRKSNTFAAHVQGLGTGH
jgi:RHS repeat-associated protein